MDIAGPSTQPSGNTSFIMCVDPEYVSMQNLAFIYVFIVIVYYTFYLEYIPRIFGQYSATIPRIFYRKFWDRIGEYVWLRDPVGNTMQVVMDADGDACFTICWNNILDYYGLKDGAWVKLTYVTQTSFNIEVRDLNLHEVQYPTPPRRFGIDYQTTLYQHPPMATASASAIPSTSEPFFSFTKTMDIIRLNFDTMVCTVLYMFERPVPYNNYMMV